MPANEHKIIIKAGTFVEDYFNRESMQIFKGEPSKQKWYCPQNK